MKLYYTCGAFKQKCNNMLQEGLYKNEFEFTAIFYEKFNFLQILRGKHLT